MYYCILDKGTHRFLFLSSARTAEFTRVHCCIPWGETRVRTQLRTHWFSLSFSECCVAFNSIALIWPQRLCATGLSSEFHFILIGSCFAPKDCFLETSRNTPGYRSSGLSCQEKTKVVSRAHHSHQRWARWWQQLRKETYYYSPMRIPYIFIYILILVDIFSQSLLM